MQLRYSRQAVMKEIGAEGQQRIASSIAVITGLGALGTQVAGILARAGVGTLRMVDRDIVEWSNLQRQCLFDEADAAGTIPKAEAAARHLRRINSEIRYESVVEDINSGNVERIVAGATVVVDGLDNFPTRMLVNEACVKHGVAAVYGACLGTFGSSATIIPGVSACLHCLFPDLARTALPPLSCETVGVLGPVAALVGAWEAAEALKIMIGRQDKASQRLAHFELWDGDVTMLPAERVPDCQVCGQRRFELLAHGHHLMTTSLCGQNAVQVVPPPGFVLDLGLLRETLSRVVPVQDNPHLLKFRAGAHDVVVFRDGRAIVFGISDTDEALRLYGKYIGS